MQLSLINLADSIKSVAYFFILQLLLVYNYESDYNNQFILFCRKKVSFIVDMNKNYQLL